MDDMILVSIDDHVVEPPDMFANHVPESLRDRVPKVVTNEWGADEWQFQGLATSTPFGMAATVGWPKEEWGFNPAGYAELRPACFDVHERVKDMDANGVLGSLNFPTMAGFNARTFTEAADKDLSLIWDPFARTRREDATVGALRARAAAAGVDVTRKPRAAWKAENEASGILAGRAATGTGAGTHA